MIEYRIGWSASSNAYFRGTTDWAPWDGDEEMTPDEIEMAMSDSRGGIPDGLEMALEASGFEWWIESRQTTDV